MKKSFYLGWLCLFMVFTNLFAQEKKENVEQLEEVVVTATKFAIKKELDQVSEIALLPRYTDQQDIDSEVDKKEGETSS